MKTIDLWNELVTLESPLLGQVADLADEAELLRVHPDYSTPLFRLARNLMVKAAGDSRDSLVKWLALVSSPNVFREKEIGLECDTLYLRWQGLDMPFSAQELLEHLQKRGVSGLRLSTAIGRWTLSVGPLVFMFLGDLSSRDDPESNQLATLTFHYSTSCGDPVDFCRLEESSD